MRSSVRRRWGGRARGKDGTRRGDGARTEAKLGVRAERAELSRKAAAELGARMTLGVEVVLGRRRSSVWGRSVRSLAWNRTEAMAEVEFRQQLSSARGQSLRWRWSSGGGRARRRRSNVGGAMAEGSGARTPVVEKREMRELDHRHTSPYEGD